MPQFVNTPRDRISDKTVYPFAMIPHEALRIAQTDGPAAFATYCALMMHLNHRTGALFPAQQTLAKELGLNRETVIIAISKLVAHDVIIMRKRFASSAHYVINDPSEWTYPENISHSGNNYLSFVGKSDMPLSENPTTVVGKSDTNKMNEQDEFNNIINDEIKIENSPNAISENQQPHEVGKMNNTQDANRGPKGRPLNPRFELYRAYCECRGEDVNIEIGRDMKLRQFSKEFIRTMTPEDVRSLYNYVYNKWLRAALSQGNNTLHSLPTMTHLKKDMAEWRASIANPRNVPETATGAKQFIQQENVVHDDAWKMRTRRTKLRIFENLYNDGLRTLDDLIDEGLTLDDWNAYIEDKE